jgi:hypothetical protein
VDQTVIVRYRTRPEAAADNAVLIENVFSALAELDPGGLEYTAYQLDDGVTFVHVARLSGRTNPLVTLPAFAEFQRGLTQRCVEPPVPSGATTVGSYGA